MENLPRVILPYLREDNSRDLFPVAMADIGTTYLAWLSLYNLHVYRYLCQNKIQLERILIQ